MKNIANYTKPKPLYRDKLPSKITIVPKLKSPRHGWIRTLNGWAIANTKERMYAERRGWPLHECADLRKHTP
jgi:hypothetical protein